MYIQNATDMDDKTKQELNKLSDLIEVFDTAINVTNEEQLCSMIREHKLTWEQCNSNLLKSKQVWIALLPHMPIEATIRNLARMTSYGLFAENSEDEQMVRVIPQLSSTFIYFIPQSISFSVFNVCFLQKAHFVLLLTITIYLISVNLFFTI